MSSYLQKKLLDHSLGLVSFAMPAVVYLACHTGDLTDAGSMALEITKIGSGYARQSITSKMNVTDPTTGLSSNSAVITFGPAIIDWGTVSYISTWDALDNGNMLHSGALSQVQTTPIGQSVQFTPGQLIAIYY